jgi:hypothetical protein
MNNFANANAKTTNLTIVRNAPLKEMTDAELVVLSQNKVQRVLQPHFGADRKLSA